MDGDVQTEKLNEGSILTEPEEGGKIVRVILAGVDGRELLI